MNKMPVSNMYFLKVIFSELSFARFMYLSRKFLLVPLVLAIAFASQPIKADDMRPVSLTIIENSENKTQLDVILKVPSRKGKPLKLAVSLDYQNLRALPHSSQTLPNVLMNHWQFERTDGLAGLHIEMIGIVKVSADVLVRLVNQEKETFTVVLNADKQYFTVPAAIPHTSVATTYTMLGIEHILGGIDHLLFVACLVFIARNTRQLLLAITGFTLAHSITLILSATDTVTIPIVPVEAVIALSIVFLAREIALNDKQSLSMRYPMAVSSSFGLLHGFGFAAVLAEIGMPKDEKMSALLFFNVGVEIGQLIFVATLLIGFWLLTRIRPTLTKETLTLPISYGCGVTATVWMVERLMAF